MNGFANRLMARSMGQTSGYGFSVLTPRPVARFESLPGLEANIESSAQDISSVGARPDSQSPPVNTVKQQNSTTSVRNSDAAEAERAEAQPLRQDRVSRVSHPEQRIEQRAPRTMADQQTVQPIDAAQSPQFAKGVITQFEAEVPNETVRLNGLREVQRERQSSAPPDITNQSHAEIAQIPPAEMVFNVLDMRSEPPTRKSAPVANVEKHWQQPPAPSISIGKIEVQFLPREPLAPPPAQAPRTRGFDNYARARRGEPR